mgnify:CR=1 FL=1
MIVEMHAEIGAKWCEIAKALGKRNATDVRNRFVLRLRPMQEASTAVASNTSSESLINPLAHSETFTKKREGERSTNPTDNSAVAAKPSVENSAVDSASMTQLLADQDHNRVVPSSLRVALPPSNVVPQAAQSSRSAATSTVSAQKADQKIPDATTSSVTKARFRKQRQSWSQEVRQKRILTSFSKPTLFCVFLTGEKEAPRLFGDAQLRF